jgi:hypothetical protein
VIIFISSNKNCLATMSQTVMVRALKKNRLLTWCQPISMNMKTFALPVECSIYEGKVMLFTEHLALTPNVIEISVSALNG